jgi:hypothetical protein
MLTQRILLYGKDEPLPEPIPLRAGPLTMVYENGDLRYIRLGNKEVIRRIYAAARDRGWGTAPNVLRDVHMDVHEDAFVIAYTCENKLNDIDFVWQGCIVGQANGTLECTFDGVARAAFLRNRLGYCALHPMGVAGAKARIEKVDGSVVASAFPKRIAPQAILNGIIKPVSPFDEMRAVAHEVQPGVWARLAFEGEIFEMEDQRNWTDGSFKTYGTPLHLPFPVEIKVGERVRQRIVLTLEGTARQTSNAKRQPGPTSFSILNSQFPIPKVGMAVAGSGKHLGKKEAARLRALKVAHVRVDLPLWEKGWQGKLRKAAKDAAALGAKLEIGLFVTDNANEELWSFVVHTRHGASPPTARYLVFHKDTQATPHKIVALARKHLGAKATLYAGANKFFTELNRNRPNAATLKLLDGLCYSCNPQVHAFDNTSIAEAPEAQAETIRTYKTFSKGKPLVISAITLKPRWSLGDNGPEPAETVNEYDPRQTSLFGAGWTVATLKNITQADGVHSITLYETAGLRGVLDRTTVFPMYHVLADVAEFGGKAVATKTSDALKVDGIALRNGKRMRVLLANLTNDTQSVSLKGLGTKARIKLLDATTAEAAMRQPEKFRARTGDPLSTRTLTLPPYTVARIDA